MGLKDKMNSDKSNKKVYNTRSSNNKNLKKNEQSESSDSSYSDSESEDEVMNVHEYRKMLQKIFPSKYLNDKIKSNEKSDSELKKKVSKISKSLPNKSKSEIKKDLERLEEVKKRRTAAAESKRKKVEEEEEEEEEEEDDDDEYETVSEEDEDEEDDESEYSESDEYDDKQGKNKNFNIIFTIGDPTMDEEYDGEDEDYEESESESESESEGEKEKNLNKIKEKETILKNKEASLLEIKTTMEKMLKEDENNEVAIEGLKDIEKKQKKLQKEFDSLTKNQKNKNLKKFRNLLNNKNVMNDYKFFRENLNLDEQKKVLTQIENVNNENIVKKPYRLSVLESDIPANLKAIALNKISSLRYMDPGNGEYYKIKNWVDTFMQIPFNKHKNLDISIKDGVEKCSDYMESSKKILDSAVYGLNDAKMQIMQMIGQWISNPDAIGTAIAIKGPMGTGKTTLVKEGISKILNREFAFIALGGATDSSFLEGHSYTYEGSTWGKIVDILVKTKTMNPVIYFDELDKISDTPKGEEIAGILTHLTDTSQNSQFHDKYFSEIDFDLSKCLFIFSYNDESKVNRILLDRMYKIQTDGYEKKDKRIISKNYLIPSIIKQVNFEEDQIIIPDETVDYIIENYTEREKGVRNLKRCLEIIHTKLNLHRLMKSDTTLFDGDKTLNVTFPFTVTTEVVSKLIKKDPINMSLQSMYL